MIVQNFETKGQLIYDARNDKVHSVELLARPKTGELDIEKFFQNVQTDSLTKWFTMQIEEAVSFNRITGIETHVNLDKRTLMEDFGLINSMLSSVPENSNITVEITQIHGLPNPVYISKLENKNIKFALDDFVIMDKPIENSLIEYKFDTIKIDRSMLMRAENCFDTLQKLKTLRRMLDVEFIVEGVENYHQMAMMQDAGFYLFQGYYFHKPEPLENLLNYF